MTKGDLRAGLREADARYAEASPSAALEQRVLAHGRARPSFAMVRWVAVAVAAAAVVAAGWWLKRSATPAGFEVLTQSATFRAHGEGERLTIEAGSARLRDAQRRAELDVEAPATLANTPTGVEVVGGRVRVSVQADPLRVWSVRVSHGRIEVLGTEFLVQQASHGGSVELFAGSIRFTDDAGRRRVLAPGERLSWPLEAEPPPPPPPPPEPQVADAGLGEVPKRPSRPRAIAHELEEADALLEQVATLRRRGQFEAAVAELEEALRGNFRRVTRERLSYELGVLLTDQLKDSSRACRHWTAHTRQFGAGRYGDDVNRARQRAGCP